MPVIQVKKQYIFNMAESNCVKTMELEMDIFLGDGDIIQHTIVYPMAHKDSCSSQM